MSDGDLTGISPSASPSSASPSLASSHLDELLDSPAAVANFVSRCRAEVGHHARATLAGKLAALCDTNLRASFIDNGGLDVLNSWLDSADCPAVVIRHALEALATLPLTQAHLIAHPQLLERLDALRSHSDESISQLADDTYSSYSHKLSSSALTGDLEDEAEAEVEAAGALENSSTSKFHLIKIDKSSADMHEHQLAIHANTEDERDLKPLVFANAVSEVGDVSVDDVLVNEENKQKQLNDKIEAIKIDSDTKNESNNNTETNNDNINIDSNNATNDSMIDSSASSSPSSSAKKKKPRRSVTWVEDSAIEKIKLFFKDEPIIKLPAIKTQAELNKERTKTLANSIPLKPSIEWSTPEKLNLPAASQAIYQSRGKDSKEKEIQAEREKKSLKTFYQPHELPPNPAEAEISTELPPPEIPIIPFHPITQTTPQQPPAQGKGDLLSQLSSLASMIGAKSPNGSSTTSTNSSVSGSLASLSSLINNLKPPTQTPQPVPYTPAPVAPYSTPAPAPAAGTSKLLSLLAGGGGSALGNIAAALSGNKPIQPTSQPNTQAPASRWDRPPQTAPNTAAPPPQQHYPPPQQHYAPPQPQQPASYAQPPPVYQQPPPAAHAPYNYQTPPVHQPPPQQYAPPPAPYSQSSYYGGQSVPAYQPPAHLQYQPPPPQPAQQPQYGGYQPQQPPHQPPAQPHSGFTSYHVPPQQHQHPPVNQQPIYQQPPPPQYQYNQPPPAQTQHTAWNPSGYQTTYTQPQQPPPHHYTAPPPAAYAATSGPSLPVYDPDALNRNKRKRDPVVDDGHTGRPAPAVRH